MPPVKRKWLCKGCWIAVALAGVVLTGCERMQERVQDYFKTDQRRLLSPEKVISPPPGEGRPINPILPNVGVVDQRAKLPPNATFPTREDLEYSEKDYVIGPLDVVEVRVLDLFQENVEASFERQVSESGYIDLPLVPYKIQAAGKTQEELIATVKDAYSPDVLLDPTVSVLVLQRRQRRFSVLGAVDEPGQYNIVRPDMRLLEALALGRGIIQQRIPYIYVIRQARPQLRRENAGGESSSDQSHSAIPEPPAGSEQVQATPAVEQEQTASAERPAVSEQAKEAHLHELDSALKELQRAMPGVTPGRSRPARSDAPSMTEEFAFTEVSDVPGGAPRAAAASSSSSNGRQEYRWTYENGRWIRVPVEAATKPAPPTAPTIPPEAPAPPEQPVAERPRVPEAPEEVTPEDPFGWLQLEKPSGSRIIAISRPQLEAGDPRMNVVIKENDVILVPFLEVGEYYIMGEVSSPGVYSLTGRDVTVKQAVAAAGNLGMLAWPENALLIRRVGRYQEQTIPLDLEAMFKGEEPDIILKPDDLIAVGTDARSIFYAVLRNAFRMTYGFGFIYDRNFSDPLFVTPKSNRFTRL